MTQEASNPNITADKVGTMCLQPTGNTDINYILSCVKIVAPDSGNINFELIGVDYTNKKLTYSFEYTAGQPASTENGTQPASGGSMGNYLLPIYMPHLNPDGSYFIPTEIEVVNAADTSKKKKGTVSVSTPIRLDKEEITPNTPRAAVAKVTTNWTSPSESAESNSITTYFILVLTKTTSANQRQLAITTSGSTINCSYSEEENIPADSVNRASIGALMSTVDGEYTQVVLEGNSITIAADNKYSNPVSFSF